LITVIFGGFNYGQNLGSARPEAAKAKIPIGEHEKHGLES
jgi:hypothetical protein